jgi:subtilisin
MHRRRHVAVLAVAALVAMAFAPASAAPDDLDVVVLLDADHPGARGAARAVAAQHDVDPTYVYEHALDGFAGKVSPGRLRGLERDPRVAVVEADADVSVAGQVIPTGVQRVNADVNEAIPTDGDGGAVDADVAILDTGIDASHPDLDVVDATTCFDRRTGPPAERGVVCEPGGTDRNGHGTHVAGTVAARNNGTGVVGVAPGARLWSVKVMGDDGFGSVSTIVAGLEHVTTHADQIDVANLSLVGEISDDDSSSLVDAAISGAVAAGVTVVLAAGNGGTDVSGVWPAGHPEALTVAALVDYDGKPGGLAEPICDGTPTPFDDDTFWVVSNYGDGVDLMAPGACITSTAPGGGLAIMFGTSMAAPHVAGGAAVLASRGLDVPVIRDTLVDEGSFEWDIDTARGVAKPLLDVSDTTVFAPVLAFTLTGESIRAQGGEWEAQVTVTTTDESLHGEDVVLSYVTQRGGSGTVSDCAVGEDTPCSLTLTNRDRSVTFTLEEVGGEPATPVQETVTR